MESVARATCNCRTTLWTKMSTSLYVRHDVLLLPFRYDSTKWNPMQVLIKMKMWYIHRMNTLDDIIDRIYSGPSGTFVPICPQKTHQLTQSKLIKVLLGLRLWNHCMLAIETYARRMRGMNMLWPLHGEGLAVTPPVPKETQTTAGLHLKLQADCVHSSYTVVGGSLLEYVDILNRTQSRMQNISPNSNSSNHSPNFVGCIIVVLGDARANLCPRS